MGQSKTNILLVDDVPVNLLLLEELLQDPERNLVKATSGAEALQVLQEEEFALVLLDVQMPEMDGFQVAERIRQDERTRLVPIIFITAISKEQEYVFKGYDAGAVDYLFKPINGRILRTKVNVFCQLFEQRRIIRQQLQAIEDRNTALQRRLDEIKMLRGLLPICSVCKKIRNDGGYWEQLEVYLREHSEAQFTHGICPECTSKLYPDIDPGEPEVAPDEGA